MSGCEVVIEDARYAYGTGRGGEAVEALCGVSLAVRGGEAVALLGKNGAGKTTLTRLLVALLKPQSGRVSVGGWDVAARRPDEMARRVGYVFQHAEQQLFARTVRDDVAAGPRWLRRPAAPVAAVLEELALTPYAATHPYDVPAPLRKVVALAGVLAMEPELLVLDEPTAGLDAAQRALVLAALARRAGAVTVIAVSHDLTFVAEAAGRVVVMRDGRIAADAPARELLRDLDALTALGLRPPATVQVAQAVGLAGAPIRFDEVVAALRGTHWKQEAD